MLIPVPGHTRGSAALLYRDDVLFTGDHLWADGDGDLAASRSVCWYDWREQKRSLARLTEHPFKRIMPGHGRWVSMRSVDELRGRLDALLRRV